MNDAEQYFSNLQNLATTQDKAKFRALALTFHSTLQRLPALKHALAATLTVRTVEVLSKKFHDLVRDVPQRIAQEKLKPFQLLIEWADRNCISSEQLPRNIEKLKNLQKLGLYQCGIRNLPESMFPIRYLKF